MRHSIFIRTLALAGLAAALAGAPAAAAQSAPTLSFGRSGGNIAPFTVVISPAGHIVVTGTAARRQTVPPGMLTALRRLVSTAQLSTMPSLTICPQTLPDFAAPWIRVGTHRVAVRGTCRPAFSKLYASLSRAVGVGA
jgi:hypothetical protein